MDPELIERSLNFHGDGLLRTMAKARDLNILTLVDPRQVSYFEYQKRAKDPKLEDEKKRETILSFVTEKASMLFKRPKHKLSMMLPDTDVNDYYAIMPPLEAFMGVPEKERHKHFLECLKKGDIVIGMIHAKQTIGFIVKLVCMDGGKIREICDLDIKALCPLSQALTMSSHENPLDTYQIKDLIICVVLDVVPEDEKIIISMKSDSFPNQTKLKLGLISEEYLPSHFRLATKLHGAMYENVLEQAIGFMNPGNVSFLCDMMGLHKSRPSLMKGLHEKEYPKEEYAAALRKAQASKWALRSVADGIGHFKAGRHTEAFQCLNKALQIDPENVEALVARGALFANNCNFSRALEDFEQAMEINPKHHNARKYMVETLVALGRQYEDKNDLKIAFKLFVKALKFNPDHREAIEAIHLLEAREKTKINKTRPEKEIQVVESKSSTSKKEIEDSASNITREKLKQLLKEDKRKEKTKKRAHSSSSSSSSTSSSATASSKSSSRKSKSRKRSYSPGKRDQGAYKSEKTTPVQIKQEQMKKCEPKGFKMTMREVKYEGSSSMAGEREKVLSSARDDYYSKDLNKLRANQGSLMYDDNSTRGKNRELNDKPSYGRNDDLMDFAEKMSKDKGKDFAGESQMKVVSNKRTDSSSDAPGLEFADLEARLNSYYKKFDSLAPQTREIKEDNRTFTKLMSSNKETDVETTPKCLSPKVTFVMKPDQLETIGKKYLGKLQPKEEYEIDHDTKPKIKEEILSPENPQTANSFKPLKIGERKLLPTSNVFSPMSTKSSTKPDGGTQMTKTEEGMCAKNKPRKRDDSYQKNRNYRSRSRSRSRNRRYRSRSRSRQRSRRRSRSTSRSRFNSRRRSYTRSRSSSSRSRSYSRGRYSRSRSYSSKSRSRSLDSRSSRRRDSRSRSSSRLRTKSRSPYRQQSRSISPSRSHISQRYLSRNKYISPRRARPYFRGGNAERRGSEGRSPFRGRGRGYKSPRPFGRGRGGGRGEIGNRPFTPSIVTRAVIPFNKNDDENEKNEELHSEIESGEEDSQIKSEHSEDKGCLDDEKDVQPFDKLEAVENMLKQHKAQKKAEILATNKDIKKKALW